MRETIEDIMIELEGIKEERGLHGGIRTLLLWVQNVDCRRSVIVNRGKELSSMGPFIIRIRKKI